MKEDEVPWAGKERGHELQEFQQNLDWIVYSAGKQTTVRSKQNLKAAFVRMSFLDVGQ